MKKSNSPKDLAALQAMDADALSQEIVRAEKEFFLLSMKHNANELKQAHTLKQAKKYIAVLRMVRTQSNY